MANNTAEHKRLEENSLKEVPLEIWGPYLTERQWGTVREDYSVNGDAWNYSTHDQARSKAYKWGEDGLGGISDYMGILSFCVSLWNGKDPILKERLFGLSNQEGNHGEDVKELYYYLDNLPSHYYMKYLYKYPINEYPYLDLINNNRSRNKLEPEYEILDTGVFNDSKYFDVFIEYAKQDSEDILIKIEVFNRSSTVAPITILPTLWFHNNWEYNTGSNKPSIKKEVTNNIVITEEHIGTYFMYYQETNELFFTENETNTYRLFGKENTSLFTKDAFHEAIISKSNKEALQKKQEGTKFAPVYEIFIEAGKSASVFLRLTKNRQTNPFANSEELLSLRRRETDEFYQSILKTDVHSDLFDIQRQAFAGLLWSKQFYHYDVENWLKGSERNNGRNKAWKYLKNKDVISMPDKWEYPWYAAWDAAFHAISMALVDPVFAKNQLLMLMREWYMNPAGQLPAYEWDFDDVNPPVHAFAALEVYHIEMKATGKADINFLKKVFQKLIINFTWWTNRKDVNGNNIFEGGFLGLDNIGIFNRSIQLPDEVVLEQTDGTSWMGMYALNMMDIALEIATHDEAFEDAATKFYEHFVIIATALNELGLWDQNDNFFYDVLCLNGQNPFPLKVRTVIGLTPLFAVSIIDKERLDKLKDFNKRIQWFKNYRVSNNLYLPSEQQSDEDVLMLSLVHKERIVLMLDKFLDENEFLSPFGIRSISKVYENNSYRLTIDNTDYSIQYDPGDSTSGLFGGNSNWRGPVWMPINYLFIKSLIKYGEFYGDTLKVECPKGSGNYLNLNEVAEQLTERLIHLFQKDEKGDRATFAEYNWFYKNENSELVLFNEYFHGNTGKGLGASHQTGWTALILNLINK
ncbi:MAG: glucosidase [Ginsengibacter sp.]